jgi:hypothetical protein
VAIFKGHLKQFYLSILFIIPISLFGTEHDIRDSIKHYYNTYKGSLIGGFHNRNSFVGSYPVKIYGLRIGMEHGEKISYSLGFYTTYDLTRKIEYKVMGNNQIDTFLQTSNFSYFSLGGEYVFFQKKRWTLGWPVGVGLGSAGHKHYKNKNLEREEYRFIMPIETGVRTHYSIFDWLGIEGTLGIRATPFGANEFNSSFYSFGVNVYLGVLYRKITKKPAPDNRRNP